MNLRMREREREREMTGVKDGVTMKVLWSVQFPLGFEIQNRHLTEGIVRYSKRFEYPYLSEKIKKIECIITRVRRI